MDRTQKWMGSVGCLGQIENIKRQSLIYIEESLPDATKRLSFQLKREMKSLRIARQKMNAKGRRNLYDRFFAAGISSGMVMSGQIYG